MSCYTLPPRKWDRRGRRAARLPAEKAFFMHDTDTGFHDTAGARLCFPAFVGSRAAGWHLPPQGWGRPSVHQAVDRSEGPVPCYQNSAQEAARSPSSLHLPRSARLLSSTERGGVVAGVLCWKVMHAVVILSPAATKLKEN